MRSSIIARPTGDCCAAKRKTPVGSRRITNLTQALHRSQTPSNRMSGAGTRTTIACHLTRTALGSNVSQLLSTFEQHVPYHAAVARSEAKDQHSERRLTVRRSRRPLDYDRRLLLAHESL